MTTSERITAIIADHAIDFQGIPHDWAGSAPAYLAQLVLEALAALDTEAEPVAWEEVEALSTVVPCAITQAIAYEQQSGHTDSAEMVEKFRRADQLVTSLQAKLRRSLTHPARVETNE